MNKQIAQHILLLFSLLLFTSCRTPKPAANSPVVPSNQQTPVAPAVRTNTVVSPPVAKPEPTTVVTNPIPTNVVSDLEQPASKPTGTKQVELAASLIPQKPRLFKSTRYPPQTPEEKAMWDWWHRMEKIDPDFEWKMPIEFYGKVLDQFGQPVAGADVELSWTTVVGPIPDPVKTISTDANGKFVVNGIQGKGIGIFVSKVGYNETADCVKGYEYADFFNDNFHVPDPNNPVLFHLHKLMDADPMYFFRVQNELDPSGKPLTLDVPHGKTGAGGDFTISVRGGSSPSGNGQDYAVLVEAFNGAGLIPDTEDFCVEAPAQGYQTSMAIQRTVANTSSSQNLSFHFYARTRDSKYGVVYLDLLLPSKRGVISCDTAVRYNPSGSRNVEFDSRKWINR